MDIAFLFTNSHWTHALYLFLIQSGTMLLFKQELSILN